MAACSQQRVRVYEDSSSADRSSCEFSCLGVESSAGVCNRGIACGGLHFHAGFAWGLHFETVGVYFAFMLEKQ